MSEQMIAMANSGKAIDVGTITVAVIYHSETGNIKALAMAASEGAAQAGAEVRLLAADEACNDDMDWADVVLFGTPSHYGAIAAGLKTFIDGTGELWRAGRLADKVYGAFVSSASTHGGQETTLASFTTIFTHWGGIMVPPGFTARIPVAEQMHSGNPHGAGHISGFGAPPTEFALNAARYQAERAVKVAVQLTSIAT